MIVIIKATYSSQWDENYVTRGVLCMHPNTYNAAIVKTTQAITKKIDTR